MTGDTATKTVTTAFWPPHLLSIKCGNIELRVLREFDIPALLEHKEDGVVDKSVPMPFTFPWHTAPDDISIGYWYRAMAIRHENDNWTLPLVILVDGELVGMQEVSTEFESKKTRTLETGSWLAQRFQGKGIGTTSRQMVVALGLDKLGMDEMRSQAILENAASLAVSKKVGYQPDGTTRVGAEKGYQTYQRMVVTKETFVRPLETISFSGITKLRKFLGL